MFLRSTYRFKYGKVHHYWIMVENVRVGRRVFQRQALKEKMQANPDMVFDLVMGKAV